MSIQDTDLEALTSWKMSVHGQSSRRDFAYIILDLLFNVDAILEKSVVLFCFLHVSKSSWNENK